MEAFMKFFKKIWPFVAVLTMVNLPSIALARSGKKKYDGKDKPDMKVIES
jgi:hypothetical protein